MKLTLHILGKKYEIEAPTVSEGLKGLKVPNPKGKGILAVEREGKVKEIVLHRAVCTRLFTLNGITQDIVIKQIASRFE